MPSGWTCDGFKHYCPACSAARKQKKLRPWRNRHEFPLGCWLRWKETCELWYTPSCVGDQGIAFCSYVNGNPGTPLTTYESLLKKYEWSLNPNDPASWKPCGTEE